MNAANDRLDRKVLGGAATMLAARYAGTLSAIAATAVMARFVTPEEFEAFRTTALARGFAHAASSPLTRSSHHAGEEFERLRSARAGSA